MGYDRRARTEHGGAKRCRGSYGRKRAVKRAASRSRRAREAGAIRFALLAYERRNGRPHPRAAELLAEE